MPACLDTLLIGLYVLADDFLVPRHRRGRPPRITDAELVCLAVAQVLLDCPGDRRFLAIAGYRLGHLFPYLPKQPGYNKRVRTLAPQVVRLLNQLVFESPSFGDRLWLLDGTPDPVRAVARDRQALGACRLRRLRLESLALPQLLGISARPGLRARWHADRH